MKEKDPQQTGMKTMLRDLHGALIEITNAMNRPQRDEDLLRQAGVSLDRALFRLLVAIERLGPIGIVELADRIGLDHTTVSRQVSGLVKLGLAARRTSQIDRRVKEAEITVAGRAMTSAIDDARERRMSALFENWDEREFAELVRLMHRFAETFRDGAEKEK